MEASWGLVGGCGLLGASWAVGSKCPFGFSLEAPASDHPGALVAWFGILLGNFGAILGCVGALLGLLGSWGLWGRSGSLWGRLGRRGNPPNRRIRYKFRVPQGMSRFLFLGPFFGGLLCKVFGGVSGVSRAFLRQFWASWKALGLLGSWAPATHPRSARERLGNQGSGPLRLKTLNCNHPTFRASWALGLGAVHFMLKELRLISY